ncbi:MAG: copper homeostasis protein CutC [Bryobacteraceae bacterium]
MKLLEVIVTSVEEAREAEDGGANRLELVRDLEAEGLTPPLPLVEEVIAAVSVPVRVMLRETTSFSISTERERRSLTEAARAFSQLPVNGLVLGFLKGGIIDSCALDHLLSATDKPVTFHRAIECVPDPIVALETLKAFAQVDRVLLNGGNGSWADRRRRLERLQESARPGILVVVGGGLNEEGLEVLAQSILLREFHAGSAVRDESGRVRSERVRKLRQLLGTE